MATFPEDVTRFVAAAGPTPTDLQVEMERYGRDQGFPLIGPELGGVLMLLAQLVGAERVFEFGSGFGYSASWLLRALPDDGQLVLTELDLAEAEAGREYLDRAGDADRATYEVGDALSTIGRYDGPFDFVLIDFGKARYREAFEAVAPKVAPGGVVVADNVMAGPFDFADVVDGLEGQPGDYDDRTRGVIDYLAHVRDAPGFTSTVLPAGTGLSISHKDREDG